MKSKSTDPLNAVKKMNHFFTSNTIIFQSVRSNLPEIFECTLLVVNLEIQWLKVVKKCLEKSNNITSQSGSFEVVLVNHKAWSFRG